MDKKMLSALFSTLYTQRANFLRWENGSSTFILVGTILKQDLKDMWIRKILFYVVKVLLYVDISQYQPLSTCTPLHSPHLPIHLHTPVSSPYPFANPISAFITSLYAPLAEGFELGLAIDGNSSSVFGKTLSKQVVRERGRVEGEMKLVDGRKRR